MAWLRRRARPLVMLIAIGAGIAVGVVFADELGRALREATSLGPWAPGVFLFGFSALAVIGVPRAVLAVTAVVAFGGVLGAALAWSGSMLAALLGFAVGRCLGEAAPARLPLGSKLVGSVGGLGPWAVVLARLSPVPFWLVNYTAGAVGQRLGRYAAATAVGLVPSSIAYAAVGSITTFGMGRGVPIRLVVGPVVLAVGAVLWWRCGGRFRASSAPVAASAAES